MTGPVYRSFETGDVEALARLHPQVFSGSMGASLGDRYLRAFFRWFSTYPEASSVVCLLNGQLAGYVLGAPHGYSPRITRELFPEIAYAVVTHPFVVLRHTNFVAQIRVRTRALFGVAGPGDAYGAETFDLVGIGTAPFARGKGIGKQLLRRFEELVFGRGFPRLMLQVYANNQAALTMYEKSGWRVGVREGSVLTLEKSR